MTDSRSAAKRAGCFRCATGKRAGCAIRGGRRSQRRGGLARLIGRGRPLGAAAARRWRILSQRPHRSAAASIATGARSERWSRSKITGPAICSRSRWRAASGKLIPFRDRHRRSGRRAHRPRPRVPRLAAFLRRAPFPRVGSRSSGHAWQRSLRMVVAATPPSPMAWLIWSRPLTTSPAA